MQAALAACALTLLLLSPAALADKTKLTMWTFLATQGTDPRSTALKNTVDGFNKSQNDYEVTVESIPFARIDNNAIQSTAAGQGPDILNVYSDQLSMHVAAKTLQPIDDLVAKLPDSERNDFVTPLKQFEFGGKLYSIPWETRVWLMWYRADLLSKAGIAVPKTLDDLAIAAGKLSNDQVMGFGMGASTGALAAGASETFTPLLWSAGGDLFDANGKAAFNSPAGVRVLTWLRDLVNKHKGMRSTVVSQSVDDVLAGVRAGTIATTFQGSFRVAAARNAAATGANLKTAPIPGWTGEKPSPAHIGGQTLGIGASSKHREGAWQFIRYYVSSNAQLEFARAGVMPSRLSSYHSSFFSQDPIGIEMQKWTEYAHDYGRIATTPKDYSKMSEEIAKAIQRVLIQNADPKAALDEAARNYDAQHQA
jgi:ABC-type glycerol-3-phosphate transport system substrate-binding protein